MVNKLSTIFVLLIIIIIAFITYWLKIEVEKELLTRNSNNGSGPEFYLKNFNNVQTKKNGDIKFTIKAINMKEFNYAEYASLTKPHLTRYKNSKPYSFIKSNTGKVISGGEKYLFTENVILTRVKTKKKKEMKLFTDELNILPNKDVVTTQKPVKIIQEPNIEIYGIGMKYDNKEGIVKLLSNVKVYYGNPRKNTKTK